MTVTASRFISVLPFLPHGRSSVLIARRSSIAR
jgi:hypothetical protein